MEEWLVRQPGIKTARARTTTGSVILFYDFNKTAPDELLKVLSVGLEGFRSSIANPQTHTRSPFLRRGHRALRSANRSFIPLPLSWLIGLTGFFVYSLARKLMGSSLSERPLSFLGVGSMIGAIPLFHRAIRDYLQKKNITLFPFLAGACAVAIFMGEAFTALEVIWVTGVSLFVEDYVADKSRRAIRESLAVTVKKTTIWVDAAEMEVPVSAVNPSHIVVIRTGERIPVDGVVVKGEALVDEAHITGRSEPEIRRRDQEVFAGTFVREGFLHVQVEKVGDDIYLNRILRLVEESLSQRSPVERRADILARRLTYFGTVATAGTLLLTRQISRALSVLLVSACPCATVLAASTAVTAGVANAARNRVLIKGGVYLEKVSEADCYCFDKTGTLTLESHRVAEIIPRVASQDPAKILALAASAEVHTTHPVGRAIVAEASRRGIDQSLEGVNESVVGKGVRMTLGRDTIAVGNLHWMEEMEININYFRKRIQSLMDKGCTVVFVAKNGKAQGLIGIASTLRPETESAIRRLRRDGVNQMFLITGDTEPVAKTLAEQLGFDGYRSSLLPEEKARYIEALQQAGRNVVVVGDGVNDALALSKANIGVAMGAGGAEVAIEAADIALVDSDLMRLVALRRLSRQTTRVIEENHRIAVSTNMVGVFLGATGRLAPLWGGLLHVIHSLGIMLNSSRLLGWRAETDEDLRSREDAVTS
jgi:cation-transporting P-type ATPase C